MGDNYEIYDIFDRMFKKVITLSSVSVINLINGLFDKDYPTDSEIAYNWTEFEDDGLKKILADTIITVNGKDAYHFEAQMTKDDSIVFRVFEYGFGHADRNRRCEEDLHILKFPEPKVLYLYHEGDVPEEYELLLDFGKQGNFTYKVKVMDLLNTTVDELNKKKMVILIPFTLLKLRDRVKKKKSYENMISLKALIFDDIIPCIETNLAYGNITIGDAQKLRRYTHKLYEHIYSHYEEFEELTDMTDESLMLDVDLWEKEFEEKLAKQEAIAKKQEEIVKKKEALVKETEEKIERVQHRLEVAESKLTDTESKLTDTESKLTDTESKLTDTESKLTDTESKLTDTESKLTDTESKLTDAESKLADSEAVVKGQQEKIAEQAREIEELRKKLQQ